MQKFTQQRALSNSLIVARQQEMGKASKWMMNFLLGRKEEKEKKKDVEENEKFSSGILPSTPAAKRRWSFGRSSSKERVRRTSKSLIDLINTNSVETLATVSSEDQQRIVNNLALVVAAAAPVESSVRASKPARYGISRAVADAAATKIQAAFRSYLARRALCALRALVKLQALVRGHLVRKQTTATLRRMHALMSIQVRARFQRIQVAEASQAVSKTDSSRYRINPQETEFRRPNREATDTNNYETLSKSQYGYLNKIGRTEHGVSTRFTGELSFAKREPYQYEEIAFSTSQNTSQHYQGISNTIPGRASFTRQQTDHAHPVSHDFSFLPNYMANTESSSAKARSRSEPRQRPELSLRTGSKRWDSNNGSQHSSPRLKHADQGLLSNNGSQHSSPRLKHTVQDLHSSNGSQRSSPRMKQAVHGNQDPWLMKPYPTKRLLKDRESDANSTSTSHSNYSNSLIANEPPVNMY